MNEFQNALGGAEPSSILTHFGLQTSEIALLAVMSYFTVALVKKHLTLPGWGLLLASALSSALWACLWYIVTMPKPVVATVMVFVTASGGWQAFKDGLGKFQFGGTSPSDGEIKPRGDLNRGPSVNPGG